MSALAAGAISDGVMVMSLGTSGTIFGYSSNPVFDRSGVICPFCDASGKYLPLVCTLNCTEVPEDVRKGTSHDVQAITRLASEVSAGCQGLNYLPFLRGERTPNWPHASGAFVGLRQDMIRRPGLMYRAALEGVTFSLLSGVNQMKALGVSKVEELIVVGGGSKNELWCQIIADLFDAPVALPSETETAALGAALQAAAVHNGEDIAAFVARNVPKMKKRISPNSKDAELYREAFERHEALGKKLFGS